MTNEQQVEHYIGKHPKWKEELADLRALFKQTPLREELKWGAPVYTLDGVMVAGMAAFKQHGALWFYQGVFLKDPYHKLINAQEGVTKALRQWRFTKEDTIEAAKVLEYLQEATENAKAGKTVPKQKKVIKALPVILQEAFKNNSVLAAQFKKLPSGKQNEYAAHIDEAKREATQQRRLEKSILLILEGKGLNDRYK